MTHQLIELTTHSHWVYLLVAAIAALDAVFPVVPSEATVITAAALAAAGRLDLAAVFVAAAAGAAVGDNGAYAIGRASAGGLRRLERWRHVRIARGWAESELRRRGALLVIVSRFVPGGRTATMLASGATQLSWRRFAAYDLAAAVLWAGYAAGLGAVGGAAFADRPLYAVGVALALAGALAVALEGLRRLRLARRDSRGTPDGASGPRA